ncbi:hypothetical protein DXG03_009343 [Asterophora parasitica]|uniref:BPL/LPL catalytic domain-containing protein n=1 Tax=Asterophora parasitica TaxID=117018 RepID=A0A9P7KC98_9AGAR|nr:hypothetical protein DXG03_009343 [Asterophora parasitica]
MNVLVYAGPEALQRSVTHALNALRSILLPQYSVQTITLQALNSQPWNISCALLVVPQCRGRFQAASATAIKEYVESGGSLLGLGIGALCTSRDQGGASSISQDILFGLFDKSAGRYIYLTGGNDEADKRVRTLKAADDELIEGIYGRDSSNEVTGFDGEKNIRVLATYSEVDGKGSIAALTCGVGAGRIAVWAPSIETPLTKEAPSTVTTVAVAAEVSAEETRRLDVLKETLLSLSLRLPTAEEKPSSRPLPQFLTSAPGKPSIVSTVTDLIAAPSSGSQLSVFNDDNDTFHFHHFAESADLVKNARENPIESSNPSEWQPKRIILCPASLPSQDLTPLFNLGLYFESLSAARSKQGCPDVAGSWGCGEALLYSEVVTSTQTMLDRNPRLLSRLPSPLVSLASHQLAGRGRGSNIWLSPSGCLSFSTLLCVSLSSFPAGKLVFIQYLFALAVVEACRDDEVLGKRGKNVRLKWPNDVYAVVDGERKKVGGILVNTSFSGGKVDIVIGCGLNVLNAEPIFSLAQLLSPGERHTLTLEKTVSNILARFEKMWGKFVEQRGSFESFMDLYLERWLHSDQLVTLTTVTPPQKVRITGITPDHGLLRTMPEKNGWSSGAEGYIDLQPDGNSFDIMSGLIKSKT